MPFEILDVLSALTTQAVLFVPNLISAVILLVIGLVLGKIVGKLVRDSLDKVKLDYYVTETQKPPISLSSIFALLAKWWIYLAFVTAALSREVLGITELAVWISGVNAFIPRILGATVIMVVGYVLSEYIKGQLKKTGKLHGAIVGKVLSFFILYVTIALALPVLGVSSTLVNDILLVIIASVGLGVAIAIGLGLKDAIADVSKRYVRKIKM